MVLLNDGPSDASTPKLSGLPKAHKLECHCISLFNSMVLPYSLSKHLVELITPLTGTNNLTARNSQEFVGHVRGHILTEDGVMVSSYVLPLLTNVPTPVAVRVADTRVTRSPHVHR